MIPSKGDVWYRMIRNEPVRVMCDPVEGYVMVRHKGCVPFLTPLKDWNKEFMLTSRNKAHDT